MMAQNAGIADESVRILLSHCRDMKRQELNLRLVTLMMMLSCTALFVLTNYADIRGRHNSGAGGQEGESPAYTMKQIGCPTATTPSLPAETPARNPERLRVHLLMVPTNVEDGAKGVYLRWNGDMHRAYDPERRGVVAPERGFYFVYVRIALSCQVLSQPSTSRLHVALHSWNQGYNHTLSLTEAFDSVTCTSLTFKNFFVGQLFDLLAGDHVSVWIGDGYGLISKASFGIYLT